jgi:hypothetical protein
MMPPNEVGPQDTTPGGTDTNNTINSKANGTTRKVLWPQEAHADLGLTDDGVAVGS